jgi:hypothetical protein
MVGSADPINGILCLKTTKMYVLLHETVGSTDPTDGILDPAMQETVVLLHETEGSEDRLMGCCVRPNRHWRTGGQGCTEMILVAPAT